MDVTVKTLTDETQILEALYTFQPQLLLLDINMPRYDGLKLLRAVRTDMRYKNLKIVMITANASDTALSYRDAFDDMWIKPLKENHLKQQIGQLSKGFSAQATEESVLSSFLPVSKFKKTLQSEINASSEPHKYLVLFGSVDYSAVAQEGVGAKNDFLVACENAINSSFSESLAKGYLGAGKFALFNEGMELQELEKKSDKFITDSEYKISIGSKETLYTTFSVLILSIHADKVDAGKLVQDAIKAYDKSLVLPSQKLIIDWPY